MVIIMLMHQTECERPLLREVASAFRITASAVSDIKNGKSWAHLPRPQAQTHSEAA